MCSDCKQPEGEQHRPSCHRQGLVTKASDYGPRIVPPHPADQPELFEKGTGTYGRRPAPGRPAKAPMLQEPPQVPYGQALAHIVRTVDAVLKATGGQWDGAARQDLISTLLIAAKKQIRYDFTEGK